MENKSSNEIISTLEQKLEEQICSVLLNFQNLTTQQLIKIPEENSWSISQCIQHLNTYGDYYLPILKHELEARKVVESNCNHKTSWLGNYFLKMLNSEKKLKARKRHLPEITMSAHKVISIHLNQQETLLAYLRLFQNLDLTKNTIPSSIASIIKLNPMDTLQFLIIHNSRHINQALKIHNFERIN